MAQRRMFSPEIVCSEEFLSMPVSSRDLYMQLGMRADDDGFIQPRLVMRSIGSDEDDLKILLAKRFLLAFENGVVVIKHWLIHNIIRADRYKPTRFQDEKKMLLIKGNKSYTDSGLQNDNQMATQVRLGKVRLGKVRLGKVNKIAKPTFSPEGAKIMEKFLVITPSLKYNNRTQRQACDEMIKKFGLEESLLMVDMVISVQGKSYAPTATTPYVMWQKIGDLLVYFKKKEGKSINIDL